MYRERFDPSLVDEIKARLPVSEVVGRYVKLKRAGTELCGLSPFNAEKTPSFFVNDRKGAWFDFSANENGDVIKFLMLVEGWSFPDAVQECARYAGLSVPGESANPDPAHRAKREAEWRRQHEAKLAAEQRRKKSMRELAYDLWREGKAVGGTTADAYLRSRGIDFGGEFASLRFHPGADHLDTQTGEATQWPVLLAAVRAPDDGRFLAVWRIFLARDGSGKAPVRSPKMGLGCYTEFGGSVWLGDPSAVANPCEGIETGLGVAGILGRRQGVQAALSTAGLVCFVPPKACTRTLIWPDGDTDRIKENRKTGREERIEAPGSRAAKSLLERLTSESHPAAIQPFSKNGRDWLDIYSRGRKIDDAI